MEQPSGPGRVLPEAGGCGACGWARNHLREASVAVRSHYEGLPSMAGRCLVRKKKAAGAAGSAGTESAPLSAPGSTDPRPKIAASGAPLGPGVTVLARNKARPAHAARAERLRTRFGSGAENFYGASDGAPLPRYFRGPDSPGPLGRKSNDGRARRNA